jgi:hypothetical protein
MSYLVGLGWRRRGSSESDLASGQFSRPKC